MPERSAEHEIEAEVLCYNVLRRLSALSFMKSFDKH